MKKTITVLLVMSMLVSGLTSCATSNTSQTTSETDSGKRVLTIGGHTRMYPNEEEYWETMAADFMAENPDVEVVLKWNGSFEDVAESLQAAKLAGETIDIYSCGAKYIRSSLIEAGLCTDMTELIKPYEDLWIDGALESGTIGEKLWSVPLGSIGTCTFYYNKDMFEELDIEIPTTFDEFVAIGNTIQAEKNITPILQQGSLASYWPMWFMETYAQSTGNDSIANVQAFLDGDKTFTGESEIQAFEMLKQFFDEGLIDVDSLNTDADGMRAAFSQGKSAMFFGGTWEYSNVMSVVGDSFEVGVFEFPSMIDGIAPQHGGGCGQSIFIPTFCDHENYDLIMDFIDFFVHSEEGGKIATAASTLLPSIKNVDVPGDEFTDAINASHADSVITYLDWIWPAEINDAIATNIPAVGAGYITAEDAVDEIQAVYDRIVKEGYQYAWWDEWTQEQWDAVTPAYIP